MLQSWHGERMKDSCLEKVYSEVVEKASEPVLNQHISKDTYWKHSVTIMA